MATTWKPVPSYPGVEVTIDGKVRIRGRIYKTYCDPTGSPCLTINVRGYNTTARVVRLVGEAWSRCYRHDRYPIYRDGNHANVRPRNIHWVLRSRVTGNPYSRSERIPMGSRCDSTADTQPTQGGGAPDHILVAR